jgi:hypothetical protein
VLPPSRACAATIRFSRTVSERNTRRPLRHQADALAGDGLGREPRDRLAEQRIAPRRGAGNPMMVDMQVVLPAPLRPSRPEQAPGLQREADAVQHVDCRRNRCRRC